MANSNKFTTTWTVSDGYVGGARPQKMICNESELLDCETEQAALELVEAYITEQFNEKVSPAYDEDEIKADIAKLFAEKKASHDAEG